MTALYVLASDYRAAAEALADLDLDPQTVADTLLPVPGYEGRYSVTADGRVWSYPNNSRAWRHSGRWLRQANTKAGYKFVALFKDGEHKTFLVHRLVAMAHIGPPPAGRSHVNHLNGVKTDNRVANLEWCSNAENIRHAHATGLIRHNSPAQIAHARATIHLASAERSRRQRAQTACKHGHSLSGENLAINHGKRVCKACQKAASRKSYLAKKASA